MSEPIPESIPTSFDRRSRRPTKRRALSPASAQAASLTSLFAKPDRQIHIPKSPAPKSLPPPPEIVANVQGSSAGAGSGEFHVYKAARRREYERIRLMEEEVKREEEEKAFKSKTEELKKKDDEKTEKNRRKRMKKKQGKGKQVVVGKDAEMKEPPAEMAKSNSGGTEEETKSEAEAIPQVEAAGLIIHDEDD